MRVQYNYYCCFAQIVLYLAIRTPFSWVLCPLGMLYPFLSTLLFLVLQDAPSSSCIFSAPALHLATSSRSSSWRMVFRNQHLYASGAHHYQGFTTPRASQQIELGNVCVYANLSMHTHLCLLVYTCECDFIITTLVPIQCHSVHFSLFLHYL